MTVRNLLLVIGLLALAGCGADPESSDVKEGDRSGSFALFTVDTDGKVTFGRPKDRETIVDIGGSRSSGRVSSSDSGGSSFEQKAEKRTAEDLRPDPPSEKDCFVREAARERFDPGDRLPSIRAATRIDIEQERYQTRQEAEQAFDRQLQLAKDGLTTAWQANRTEIDAMRGAIKVAAMGHNKDILRTLSFAGDVADAGVSVVQEFRTSVLTAHGASLRRAARDLGHAYKTLNQRFTGRELADRGAVLKNAGNALKVADALFSEGDIDSGEYLTNVALTMIDVAVSYMPMVSWAKDIVEAASGYSLIYQRPLSTTERTFAVIGAVTGGIGSKVITTQKALSAWHRLFVTSDAGAGAMEALRRAALML